MSTIAKPGIWQSVKRGLRGTCPNCGQGKLFKSYLKQVDNCAHCSEAFGHIRTEDGPAWLTILVVGHILAPFMVFMAMGNSWPDWVAMTVWPLLAIVMMFFMLPLSKGVFLSLIWRSNCAGAEK